MYCHNPYPASSTVLAKVMSVDEDVMGEPHSSGLSDSGNESRSMTPEMNHEEEGMGRRTTSKYYDDLAPVVPYYAYEAVSSLVRREDADRMGLTRLFVGQVPYHLEPAHVAWMLELLSGRRVPLVEKIVRWTQSRKPCGCFHVYCAPEDADAIRLIDQTVLCEAEVMWAARDAAQKNVLVEHCKQLQANPDLRVPLMPYQLMTVQLAISSYQRPETTSAPHSANNRRQKQTHAKVSAPAQFSAISQHGLMFPTHANQLW
ncbi:Hypothetical protein, putative [Bodo saltans]|uniref:Uncharacterized protein n=1 Tax=Bodo saltans TaxID=75058 RepID=A0A0S4JBH1_BODSA|nr:Hypothetical protein, putative [Bodo saltans]|eukprot:CUG84837.1 Hypothetical protein, putative [Bodo saltans]